LFSFNKTVTRNALTSG